MKKDDKQIKKSDYFAPDTKVIHIDLNHRICQDSDVNNPGGEVPPGTWN